MDQETPDKLVDQADQTPTDDQRRPPPGPAVLEIARAIARGLAREDDAKPRNEGSATVIPFPGEEARSQRYWEGYVASMIAAGLDPAASRGAIQEVLALLPQQSAGSAFNVRPDMTPEQLKAEVQRVVSEAELGLLRHLVVLAYKLHLERSQR